METPYRVERGENVAVYWDFENIHASLCTVNYGQEWYQSNRFTKQSPLVDVSAIIEYVSSVGNVNINKAYANWNFLQDYRFTLQENSVDLVQLFPRGKHAKNGADIRLAIDVVEDLAILPHIETVVIVGGDSDYIAIAQKVRQKGKRIIGIGVKATTNQYWIKACNEFKFYSTLLAKSMTAELHDDAEYDREDLDTARELLVNALRKLAARTGEAAAPKAVIKPMMIRLDPSFDETNFGFATFAGLLEKCGDIVEVSAGEHDQMVSLKGQGAGGPLSEEAARSNIESAYLRVLRTQQVRLPDPRLMSRGIEEAYKLLKEEPQGFSSYEAFKDKLRERLSTEFGGLDDNDASKIKQLLYKAFSFRLSYVEGRSRITLAYNLNSAEDLKRRVFSMIVKRISDSVTRPDARVVSSILYGDPDHASQAESLIRSVDSPPSRFDRSHTAASDD